MCDMLKNVTIRRSNGEIVGDFETFPHKEAEQRDKLRTLAGPGRYKISRYNKTTGRVENSSVFVGTSTTAGDNTRGALSTFAGMGGSPDLAIYRELIFPLAQDITRRLDEIQSQLAEVLDGDTEPMNGTPETDLPQGGDDQTRIVQAIAKLKAGEPIENLMSEFGDLIPEQYAGFLPMLLNMMKGQGQ